MDNVQRSQVQKVLSLIRLTSSGQRLRQVTHNLSVQTPRDIGQWTVGDPGQAWLFSEAREKRTVRQGDESGASFFPNVPQGTSRNDSNKDIS